MDLLIDRVLRDSRCGCRLNVLALHGDHGLAQQQDGQDQQAQAEEDGQQTAGAEEQHLHGTDAIGIAQHEENTSVSCIHIVSYQETRFPVSL